MWFPSPERFRVGRGKSLIYRDKINTRLMRVGQDRGARGEVTKECLGTV